MWLLSPRSGVRLESGRQVLPCRAKVQTAGSPSLLTEGSHSGHISKSPPHADSKPRHTPTKLLAGRAPSHLHHPETET